MIKYNEFIEQNSFVVNISVFWLNKAVLTNNFIRGLTKFWKKSLILKKNLFLQFSTIDIIKTCCRTVFFSVNLPAMLLTITLKQRYFFFPKANTLPQLIMLFYNLINNCKYKDVTKMNVLHVTFSFSIYMIKSIKQLHLKYRFLLY